MAARYPGQIFAGLSNDPTFTQADKLALSNEIVAVETTLGTNPHGDDATVDARLDRIESTLTANQTTPAINLRVINGDAAGASPTTKVWITWDVLSIQGQTFAAGSQVVNIAAAGAGGLDTSSPAPSTWYAIYVIHNPATVTTAGLCSTNFANAPTMPAGYTLKRRVGAVRRDGSNAFLTFEQHNQEVLYQTDDSAAYAALSVGNATAYTSAGLDLTPFVPPLSVPPFVRVQARIFGTWASAGNVTMSLRRSAADPGIIAAGAYGNTSGTDAVNEKLIRLGASRALEYKLTTASNGGGGISGAYLYALGYQDPV